MAWDQLNSAFTLIETIALTVSGLKLFRSASQSQTLPTTENTLSQKALDVEMLNKVDTSFLKYRRFLFLNIVAHLSSILFCYYLY
jgi:hypothetical protein